MKNEQKMILFSVFTVFVILFFDLFFKYAIKWNWLSEIDLISGVLAITKHENFGLIGNFPLPYLLIIAMTSIAFVILLYAYKIAYKQNKFYETMMLACIMGGALGNFIDRIVNGYVFDWMLLFNISVINIADIAITLGIIGYVVLYYNFGKIKVC